ncbi:unnamed protein product [Angiostrongylus costaricensis]|uniref:G_PROTEIN_RECEP_F1_2 domain-containing protein n=1 Tax=Angiostrongylus costaricensis TaxID=334426 RepID=A0A158PKR7_ANGCS|nr:unnamed protein product [Angiostrongylus costaricensis]
MHNDSLIDDDDDDGELYELSLYELIFWCILYVVIALLAVVGNSLVIYITLIRLRSRAVTTHFIINLALADLLTGIFAIPFKFQAALFQEWFLPWSLCQIVPYAETVSLSVSVFTLTASAVHEFRTVFFAKNRRVNGRNVKSFVVVIWVIAAVVSLPHGLFHKVYEIPDVYNIYLTIIHYFVPMIILDTAYTMIAIKKALIKKMMNSRKNPSYSNKTSKSLLTHTDLLKVVQLMNMLMIVVACFSLCWFPLETYLLLNEVRPEINGWKYINVLFFCSHWLAMSNSCLNPIIYGLYNKIISACDLPGARGEYARRWTTDVNS